MNAMIANKEPSKVGDNSELASIAVALKYNSGPRRCRRSITAEISTEENITKDSLLWFQSLKKHWLNSPRTPIQPILPIPPTILTETSDPIVITPSTTTVLNNQNENSSGNRIEVTVEKSAKSVRKGIETSDNSNTISSSINGNLPSSMIAATATAPTSTTHRERLVQFYSQYNPSKLNNSTIESTLQKYLNREEELCQSLYDRYCRYLPIPNNINHQRPIVFLEFEYNNHYSNAQQGQPLLRATVQIQLFHDVTPYTAENFRCLCTGEKGFIDSSYTKLCYINTYIHRVVPKMCIQGGDITTGDGTGGRSIFASSLRSDPKTDLWGNFMDETFMTHSEPGLLSMANNGPNRNNSQFFITLRSLPHLNGKHVVFGKVISGMETVNDISNHTVTDRVTKRPLPDYAVKIVDCGEIQQGKDDTAFTRTTWIRASGGCNSNSKNDCDTRHGTTNADVSGSDPTETCNANVGNTPGPSKTYYADTGSTGPNEMDMTTRSEKSVTGSDAVPTCKSSFGAATTCGTATIDLISDVQITDDCNDIVAIVSINPDPDVVPNVDMKSLVVQSNESKIASINNSTEDALPIESSLQIKTANVSNTTEQANTVASDCSVIMANISEVAHDMDALSKILPSSCDINQSTNLSNGSHSINCHTQPTCRTLFESLLVHETLSVISDTGGETCIVMQQESIVPINTDKSKPSGNASDNLLDPSAPQSPPSQNISKNDESTVTAIDTSFGCDTSNCSILTTASSTSEQVEWLHRLIDEAQEKLRITRKKLEDRIKVLKCSPSSVGLGCDTATARCTSIHNIHQASTIFQPHCSLPLPSEVHWTVKNDTLPSPNAVLTCETTDANDTEEVPINYQYISLLLQDKRSHNDFDGKVNLTMPSLPADIGLSLLLNKLE